MPVRSVKRSLPRRECARFCGKEEEPSPAYQGEGHGRGGEPGLQPRGTSRRRGLGNGKKVAAGTGEALPGPAACGCWCRRSVVSYNR